MKFEEAYTPCSYPDGIYAISMKRATALRRNMNLLYEFAGLILLRLIFDHTSLPTLWSTQCTGGLSGW